jgi:demethylmenaquinone methyltransferase/2-methoxy-6-polyprenyl-1,4-benzoquinol methylase
MGQRALRKGLPTSIALAEQLPFADGTFDRLIMVDTFHHLDDQERAAREAVRVLAPGGVAVIEEPDIRLGAVRAVAMVERLLLMRSRFYSVDDMTRIFRRAGAQRIESWEDPPRVRLVVHRDRA